MKEVQRWRSLTRRESDGQNKTIKETEKKTARTSDTGAVVGTR